MHVHLLVLIKILKSGGDAAFIFHTVPMNYDKKIPLTTVISLNIYNICCLIWAPGPIQASFALAPNHPKKTNLAPLRECLGPSRRHIPIPYSPSCDAFLSQLTLGQKMSWISLYIAHPVTVLLSCLSPNPQRWSVRVRRWHHPVV
jgi:hypothetical protein